MTAPRDDPLVFIVAYQLVPGGACEFLSDRDGVIRLPSLAAAAFVADRLESRGCFWAVPWGRTESEVAWAEARDRERSA